MISLEFTLAFPAKVVAARDLLRHCLDAVAWSGPNYRLRAIGISDGGHWGIVEGDWAGVFNALEHWCRCLGADQATLTVTAQLTPRPFRLPAAAEPTSEIPALHLLQ